MLIRLLIGGAVLLAALPAAASAAPSKHAGLDSGLAALADAAPGEAREVARERGLKLRAGRVRVEIETATGVVEARVPVDSLEELAAKPSVSRVVELVPPHPDAVPGEGVAHSLADAVQARGVTGRGVDVAIIDAGFAGYTFAQANGDLPASVQTVNHCPTFEGSSHGRQVAEVVHEMAPAAVLHLICTNSRADLALAEQYVRGQGIEIISRSLSEFNQSRGDGSGGPGTVDAVARSATAAGVLWVNSAGNYARNHWSGTFTDPDSDRDLNWSGSDETNQFRVGADDTQCVAMKWDSWPTTALDYDLYLRRESTGVVEELSVDFQGGNEPPSESGCFRNDGPADDFGLIVRLFGLLPPPDSPRIDIFAVDAPSLEYPVAQSSVTDISGVAEIVSVGAVCRLTNGIQGYSSQGPTIGGLVHPDLAGPTPVSNTLITSTSCGRGFGGTSAAAPHVAGAAALYQQATGLGGAALHAQLESSAARRDLGDPGKDTVFGAGLLTVDVPLQPCAGMQPTIVGTTGADAIDATPRRDVILGLAGNDRFRGLGGKDRICGGEGSDRLFGGAGRDRLFGETGRDRLAGGPGRDKLVGGKGRDRSRQ